MENDGLVLADCDGKVAESFEGGVSESFEAAFDGTVGFEVGEFLEFDGSGTASVFLEGANGSANYLTDIVGTV